MGPEVIRAFTHALLAAGVAGAVPSAGRVTVSTADGVNSTIYGYRLVEPRSAALQNGARVPLVVFLHGSGERGSNNEAQLKHFVSDAASDAFQEKNPCFVLAVQCPAEERWIDIPLDDQGKAKWSDGLKTAPAPTRALHAVQLAIDEVMRTKQVDPARVYLTGISMGGFGAFDLAVRTPEQFAAMASICGGGDPARAGRLRELPVLVAHGIDDPVVPIACSRAMADAVRTAGGSVTVREYQGVGHEAWTKAYTTDADGVLTWMFAQKSTKAAAPK